MNQVAGIITSIETAAGISLIHLHVSGLSCTSLVIDTPETATYLQTENAVYLVFKETEVSIGKNVSGGLSLRNRFPSKVKSLQTGQILTKVELDCKGFTLNAIITTQSATELSLSVGDQVEGLVKTNEVSILERPL